MNLSVSRSLGWLSCAALVALLAGCGKTSPPQFRANMVAMVQQQIPRESQQEISNILDAMFGTPDEPYVLPETGLDMQKLQMAAGPVHSDQFGRETGLYRRHCAHCHGTTGDGLGPTALILNPYPRDYRQGKFKFKSTERPAKPTEHDLETVIRQGVQGTAMPSFALLPDPQIKALVEYVKYLSLRGQTEIRLIDATADLSEGEKLKQDRALLVEEVLTPLSESWTAAIDNIIQPEPKPATELAKSIDQGRELFYSTKANCVKCHGPSAMGDGQTNDYDDWNKVWAEMAKGLTADETKLATEKDLSSEDRSAIKQQVAMGHAVLKTDALPPRNAIPRNLRQNIYRGGRAPIDVYRRIYAGINGVPMPGVGPSSPGGQGTLSSEEIWALVDYVQSLPYEAMSLPPRQRPTVTQAKF